MKRRTFLKIAGLGSISLAGCTAQPEKNLYALINAIEDGVTGRATWYASTCRECPAGCGILVKNREGRITKIEGNPFHPINKGKLCIRGQAALQGVYNPRRLKAPLMKENGAFRPISYKEAESIIAKKASQAALNGKHRVRMISEMVGEPLLDVFNQSLMKWNSKGALVFEPFAYESLKTANKIVFGIDGLPSYRMAKADVLVSFGADFLETWLSPVAYARRFKKMHAFSGDKKGMFIHIGPYRSLTGANADVWVSCRPGMEAVIALGLIRELSNHGAPDLYPPGFLAHLTKISAPYTKETVIKKSGITPEHYDLLVKTLGKASMPLALGTGSGTLGDFCLHTDVAVNLLNVVLDPRLKLFNFEKRYRVEIAARRSEVVDFFNAITGEPTELLLIHRSNPAFYLAGEPSVEAAFKQGGMFKVCFSNVMNETATYADLIFPPAHYLESWDEYAGIKGMISMIQPTMGGLYKSPGVGEVFLRAANENTIAPISMKTYLHERFKGDGNLSDPVKWVEAVGRGGAFETTGVDEKGKVEIAVKNPDSKMTEAFGDLKNQALPDRYFALVPGIRSFDGRGKDHSWLSEIPEPITKVSWQNPLMANPATLSKDGIRHGEIIRIKNENGQTLAPVYAAPTVRKGIYLALLLQDNPWKKLDAEADHPIQLLQAGTAPLSGGPRCETPLTSIEATGRLTQFAHTDGSRNQMKRKIALTMPLSADAEHPDEKGPVHASGLSMDEFPLTLPLPEGYDPKRDFYPPHDHDGYRWSMIVDLDRCIGCGACSAACYAENNIGVVGEERMIEGREMSWLRVERYHDPDKPEDLIFFPMMCQHCDNAPCESVCPVYAPHHSKEGLNNQIYNRCIGTRFCSQNCPYKVRRFNWFDWKWDGPLKFQLNPEVTVRSKGVMEKCSFCVQRIKQAHGRAKDENRDIKDGEVTPACVQTCPTGALTFGNLMDPNSRVRQLAGDSRAYQVMGYLNTKPAVIYLKKVVREIG